MEKADMAHATLEQTKFDVHKAIAATAYLVERTGASMYPVMKMMYLADKMHLGKYGRFIAGDSYCAMEQGPVPSHTYNMVKLIRGEKIDAPDLETAREYFRYAGDHMIQVIKQPDFDELSDSDIECLDEIVRVHNTLGKWAVRDMSHDPAWDKTWSSRRFRRSKPMSIEAIAADLDCSEELLAHLRDPAPGSA